MNKIIIDAMGGDAAPQNEILGGLEALKSSTDLSIIFIGDKTRIDDCLREQNVSDDIAARISVVNATENVTMKDDPIAALKTKQDSSMVKGIAMLKQGEADGYVSAGNTGATLTIATMLLGRIDGVTRPTIGAFIPSIKDTPTLLMDVGATLECKSRFLYEYAIMGSIYYNAVLGIEHPTVGLLNVGEEDSKGTTEHIETNKKLCESNLNFYGNVEGGDILMHNTDVVITDGFSGNVLLKFAESFIPLFKATFKRYAEQHPNQQSLVNEFSPIIKELLQGFDPEKYGGVPLLGVNGTVIIGHGSSSPEAIKNMVFSAVTTKKQDVCNQIKIALSKTNQ
jgi:glycerol-3-phosphate acyltransferase PlsX